MFRSPWWVGFFLAGLMMSALSCWAAPTEPEKVTTTVQARPAGLAGAESEAAEPEVETSADLSPRPEGPKPGVRAIEKIEPKLSAYEPVFFGFTGWNPCSLNPAQGEPRLPFLISIQYPVLPLSWFGDLPGAGAWLQKVFDVNTLALNFAYTGRYDFFLYTRYSAPVVSRRQNPGGYVDLNHFWWHPQSYPHGVWHPLALTAGYFHESNGQDIDNPVAYAARQAEDGHAQDYVSRGWDYVLVGAKTKFEFPNSETPPWMAWFNRHILAPLDMVSRSHARPEPATLTLGTQWLGFKGQGFGAGSRMEEDDTWDTVVTRQLHRSDYDGLRFSGVLQSEHWRVAETVRSGYTNPNHWSSDFSLTCKLGGGWFPLSVHWFNGYGPDLVTYHVWSNSIMLGLEFSD